MSMVFFEQQEVMQCHTAVYQSNFAPETHGFSEQENTAVYLALLVPLGVEILDGQIQIGLMKL